MFLRFKKTLISIILLFFFFAVSNLHVNAGGKLMLFNLNDDGTEQIVKYNGYRKCKGLLDAYLYGLPIVPTGVIIDDYISDEDIVLIKKHLGDTALCRPDAPLQKWVGLPSGRDLKIENINEFFKICREANSRAILLCFCHPSIYFTGNIVERHHILGAMNILIDWGHSILIEYVGQGFDCGELTKGRNAHHSVAYIPWYVSDWPPGHIWNHIELSHIEPEKYKASRQRRIESLSEIGYDKKEIEDSIPLKAGTLSKKLFCDVYKKCIKNVVEFSNDFDKKVPIMIMLNFYEGNNMHVFEIWNAKS